jgi:SAM-dependent methyltransferase
MCCRPFHRSPRTTTPCFRSVFEVYVSGKCAGFWGEQVITKVSPNNMNQPIYEQIGQGYAHSRQADPRWAELIHRALKGSRNLVNIGAGSGSYEPGFMEVVAVEPSRVMVRQRPKNSAPVVRANAEQLPFADDAFDVALAILTTHHWLDPSAGLREMRRVARSQVIVTWDPMIFAQRFWLVRDYLPEIGQREQSLATLSKVLEVLGNAEVTALNVPADCVDGVFGAYWRRPDAYLSLTLRSAMSGLALTESALVERAMKQLRTDLASGAWRERNAELLELQALDLGYRLVKISV